MMRELVEIEDAVAHILEKSDYLLEMAGHSDAEVRMRSVEALNAGRNYYAVREVLASGLDDVDELVRVECLEFIGDMRDLCFNGEVERLLDDEDWLVRGVAAIVLAKIGQAKSKALLESRVKAVETDEERIRYYLALAMFGAAGSLDRVFDMFTSSSNYRLRCAVANLLDDCIEYLDRNDVLRRLKEILRDERDDVVRKSLLAAVESIESE